MLPGHRGPSGDSSRHDITPLNARTGKALASFRNDLTARMPEWSGRRRKADQRGKLVWFLREECGGGKEKAFGEGEAYGMTVLCFLLCGRCLV